MLAVKYGWTARGGKLARAASNVGEREPWYERRPAGGDLLLTICSPPGRCVFVRETERTGTSIHHCQGLSVHAFPRSCPLPMRE